MTPTTASPVVRSKPNTEHIIKDNHSSSTPNIIHKVFNIIWPKQYLQNHLRHKHTKWNHERTLLTKKPGRPSPLKQPPNDFNMNPSNFLSFLHKIWRHSISPYFSPEKQSKLKNIVHSFIIHLIFISTQKTIVYHYFCHYFYHYYPMIHSWSPIPPVTTRIVSNCACTPSSNLILH